VTHTHALPRDVSPLSWKGLGVIALSGGLLPSPTALIVLLGAVALHRVAFGVALVAAFSIGLASALTLVGVIVLRARDFAASRLGSRRAAWLQVASAAAIVTVGLVLTGRAFTQF
jgi:ABC-type nickel/cobalt efflux system permease component RcnA